MIQKSRVAKVVCLHDRVVEGGEIQGRDRNVVVASLRLDDSRPLVCLVPRACEEQSARDQVHHALKGLTFRFHGRYEIIILSRLSEKLRNYLDLLSAGKQIVKRDPSDSRHLGIVYKTHELV